MVMHVSHSFLSPPLSFQQRQNGGSPSVRNAILKQPMRRQPWRHRRTGAVHKTPPLLEKLFFWGAGAGLEESRRLSSTTTSQWRCAVQLLASRPSVETLGATSSCVLGSHTHTERIPWLSYFWFRIFFKKTLVILSLSRKCVCTTSPVLPASKIPTAADVVSSSHSGKEKQQEKG